MPAKSAKPTPRRGRPPKAESAPRRGRPPRANAVVKRKPKARKPTVTAVNVTRDLTIYVVDDPVRGVNPVAAYLGRGNRVVKNHITAVFVKQTEKRLSSKVAGVDLRKLIFRKIP